MNGPEGAATNVVAWLTTRIPARLRVLEQRYGLPAGGLPDPVKVLDHERGPIPMEHWPSVYVLSRGMGGMQLVDVRDDSSEIYQVTYGIRVLVWVRAEGYEAVDLLRKRYILAVREALLERKQLTPAATYGSGDLGSPTAQTMIAPETMREDYSEVILDSGRTIAGAYLDVNVLVTEVLDPIYPALGTAETIDSDTTLLPPHPGL